MMPGYASGEGATAIGAAMLGHGSTSIAIAASRAAAARHRAGETEGMPCSGAGAGSTLAVPEASRSSSAGRASL